MSERRGDRGMVLSIVVSMGWCLGYTYGHRRKAFGFGNMGCWTSERSMQ